MTRCRRRIACIATIPTHASTPTIQLQVPPIVPSAPPPRRRKSVSIGAIVCPLAIHHATPRHTRNPPRVTMNDGTPTYATIAPWNAPIAEPRTSPSTIDDDPRERVIEPDPSREPVVLRDGHHHPHHRHHRADRQVDVAGHDDQDHPGRHDRDDRGLDRQVPQVPRGEERVTRGDDLEDDPDDRQGDEHPGEASVDLGRPQHRPDGTGLGSLLPLGSLSCRCRPGRRYLGLSQSAPSYATEACAPHGPQPVRGACRERSGFGQR